MDTPSYCNFSYLHSSLSLFRSLYHFAIGTFGLSSTLFAYSMKQFTGRILDLTKWAPSQFVTTSQLEAHFHADDSYNRFNILSPPSVLSLSLYFWCLWCHIAILWWPLVIENKQLYSMDEECYWLSAMVVSLDEILKKKTIVLYSEDTMSFCKGGFELVHKVDWLLAGALLL